MTIPSFPTTFWALSRRFVPYRITLVGPGRMSASGIRYTSTSGDAYAEIDIYPSIDAAALVARAAMERQLATLTEQRVSVLDAQDELKDVLDQAARAAEGKLSATLNRVAVERK